MKIAVTIQRNKHGSFSGYSVKQRFASMERLKNVVVTANIL